MIPCIIQARMSSVRLPGKVLQSLAGVPLLLRVVNRVKQSKLGESIIVATSTESSDDPVEDLCVKNGISFYRGNLENVASRFKDIIEKFNYAGFARISADSPFIDPNIINTALDIFDSSKYDLVTNTLKRTYPRGQSVQIIQKGAFLKGYSEFTADEQEHVLVHFQNHADKYRVFNFEQGSENMSNIDVSLNEPGDFELAEQVLERLGEKSDGASWEDISKIYKQVKAYV